MLLEGEAGEPTRMDHLGVEVASTEEVTAATGRLADAGLATRVEDNTTCCYAVQDKVWVTGPGGEPWEVYTVTGDARPDLEGQTEAELSVVGGDGTCCRPRAPTPSPRRAPAADRRPPRTWPCSAATSVAGSRAWISTRWPTSSTRVPPEEFIDLRKMRQDEAKADGDKALAKEIGALPKPSAAAWASNLLVREQRAEIEGLVELGNLLREAQESLAGDQLKALDVQRRQLITALTRQARALANERGHPISTSVATQVEETLRAAMADPDAGEALLSGRLTSPMSYSGMGTTVSRPDLRLVRPPKPEPAPKAASRPRGADADERRREREEEKQRAAEERRRRQLTEARQAVADATALADEALAVAEEERRKAEELDERRAQLQARATELADELARVEEEADLASSQHKAAERRRKTAERQAADATAARDHAQAHLDDLTAED